MFNIDVKRNYIIESEDQSELDINYKSKGTLNLNSFNKTEIDNELAKQYDIECIAPTLKEFKGYLYTDNKGSFVGLVAVATYKNRQSWIQPITVSEKYRGYNLSKQLMEVAINELKAQYLAVYSDNKVAIKIYKDYGFKVYKEVKYNNGLVYFMTIDPKRKINKKYLEKDYNN